jgi:hypothetical protein
MIQYWGVEEVGKWLENIGLAEYRELFARHDICGNELLTLTRPDLKVSTDDADDNHDCDCNIDIYE